jgi:hypothetical protein
VSKTTLAFIVPLLFVLGCTPEQPPKHVSGFPYTYLLNTHKFLDGELKKYGKVQQQFVETTQQKQQKDSNYYKGTQVDWPYFVQPFLDIDLHQAKFDSIYAMTQDVNTAAKQVTITYLPLYANLPLQKMYVVMNIETNNILSVYAETNYHKPWSQLQQKMLYNPGKMIQVSEYENGWFSAKKQQTKTLYFPPQAASTMDAIIF